MVNILLKTTLNYKYVTQPEGDNRGVEKCVAQMDMRLVL